MRRAARRRQVKTVRAIRFIDVVPLADLLDRLVADAARPAVASRLTTLLLPSYLPAGRTPPEQLARAIAMAQQHPRAAEAFYRRAGAQAPAQAAASLLVVLHHAVCVYLQRRGSGEAAVAAAAAGRGGKAAGKKAGGKAGKRKGRAAAAAEDGEEDDAQQDGDGDGAGGGAGGEEDDMGPVVGDLIAVLAALMQSLRPRLDEEPHRKLRAYVAEHVAPDQILALLQASFCPPLPTTTKSTFTSDRILVLRETGPINWCI
jgi:hypothetical protein